MRILASVLALSLVASGCASTAYQISGDELHRLVAVDPAQRGQRVRVDQELSDVDVADAEAVDANTELRSGPSGDLNIQIRHDDWHAHGNRGGGAGGGHTGSGGGGGGGGGGDGKGAAIAILIAAATAMVIVAAIEGSRFDGDVQLHPMHPIHLFGRDGGYAVVPLAWVDRELAAWADHAVVRSTEGPWHELDRAPLWRTGWTYSLFAGASSLRSVGGDTGLGSAFAIQLGYFPRNDLGIVGSMGFAWRDNSVQQTLFDARFTGELQYLPVQLGKHLHAGGYAGLGSALRAEDGYVAGDLGRTVPGSTPTTLSSSRAYTGGGLVQLGLHTRIALTARFGVAAAHGELMREAMLGLSVY